jgi:ketosteroid isomerase-like protein
MSNHIDTQREQTIRAIEAFLDGLVRSSADTMPFDPDIVLISPLDPEHPKRGKEQAIEFLKTRVFPKIPVRGAKIERHIVEGENAATLWEATFKDARGGDVVVRIFDFFRVTDGLIREARFFFDPKPLKEILESM